MPSTVRPPKEFLPWFARLKSGHWVVARADYVAQKIDHWRRNKRGIRRWWDLTPAQRRVAYDIITGRHRPTWTIIERLMQWSDLTAYYWLGPKPSANDILAAIGIAPEPEPAPEPPTPEPEPEPEPPAIPAPKPQTQSNAPKYNFFAV